MRLFRVGSVLFGNSFGKQNNPLTRVVLLKGSELRGDEMFRLRLQTARADFHPLAVNASVLQIDTLTAFGGDIGVTSALGRGRVSSTERTHFCHSGEERIIS